jgi:apolipoprotein N-acyltransferase
LTALVGIGAAAALINYLGDGGGVWLVVFLVAAFLCGVASIVQHRKTGHP